MMICDKFVVELNEVEQRLARYIATRRQSINSSAGINDLKFTARDSGGMHLDGFGGELAFCRLFNVYPDLQVNDKNRADCRLHCGLTVDVKTTHHENGRLISIRHKVEKQADLYALVVGRFPRYRLVGLATAEELFSDESLKDLGHGPTYMLDQDRLSLSPWLVT